MQIPQGWSVVKQWLITVAYLDHGPEDGYEWQAWCGEMDVSALIEECMGEDALPESLDRLVLADIKSGQIDGCDDADDEPIGRQMPLSYFDSADRRTGGL